MKQPFFITGLPQSRTAWLANLFCTGNVFCHHDLLGEVDGLDAFRAKLDEDLKQGPAGDSDSGLMAFYVVLWNRYPQANWILIQRNFDDAWKSLCEFVGGGPWQEKLKCSWDLHDEMKKQWGRMAPMILSNPRCLTVAYDSLDDLEKIEQIWQHCVPEQKFDRRRAEALQKLSVRPYQAKCSIRPQFNLINEVKKLWPSGQAS